MSNKDENTDDLIKKIRRQKLLEEQEEEEEAARKAARQQQDTEEDDENLRQDEEEEKEKNRDNREEDNDDDDEDEEEENNEEDDENKDNNNQDNNNDEKNDEGTEDKKGDKDKQKDNNKEKDNKEEEKNPSDNSESKPNSNDNKPKDNNNKKADSKTQNNTKSSSKKQGSDKQAHEQTPGENIGKNVANNPGKPKEFNKLGKQNLGNNMGKNASKEAGKQASKKAAEQAAKQASKTVTKAGSKAAASALGPILFWVIIIILIIIILIGIIFFFVCMPGMVIGKIGTAINDFRKSVDGFFSGSDYAKVLVGKKEVVEAAEYLSQMGYDLEGFGFLSEDVEDKISARADDSFWDGLVQWWNENDEDDSEALDYEDFSEKSASERKVTDDEEYHNLYLSKKYNPNDKENTTKKNILLATTKDGEVKYAKSKYLTMYLTADNAIYLVRNYYTDFGNRLAKLIGLNDTRNGSGLISFVNASDVDAGKYIKNASGLSFSNCEGAFMKDRVEVYRADKIMRVYNSDDGIFTKSWYNFNMNGWSSKYGVPLQLSLAFHLSSLAPDFAYEVAKIGAEDTVVEMGLLKVGGNTRRMLIDLDIDGDGNSEKYYLESNTAVRIHKDGNDNDEEGYDTINEALNSDFADYDETKDKEEQKEEAKGKMKRTLEDVEEELKKKTQDGQNPIQFGTLGYCYEYYGTEGAYQWNNLSENDYYINVNKDEYLSQFITALIDNNLLYVDKDKNNRLKKCDGADLNKAKEMFFKYFKLAHVKEVAKQIYHQAEINKYYSPVEEVHKNGEFDNSDYECKYTKNYGDYTKTFIVKRLSREQAWEWYFEGTTDITFKTSLLDDIFGVVSKHFPVRTYYKLTNADTGEVVKYKNENEDLKASDFVPADGGNTFYNDSENTGEFWRRMIPNKIAKAVLEAIGESTDNIDQKGSKVVEILDEMDNISMDDYTKYTPMILEVENHWYQDVTFEGSYEWDTSESAKVSTEIYTASSDDTDLIKQAAQNNVLYMDETTSGKVRQVADATKKGKAGQKIKDLLKEKYFIYDGTRKSDTKQQINFANTSVDAIAMLEQIQGEDAQDIIRMFKELMANYNIFFEEAVGTKEKKELFKKVIKDYANSDNLLTDGDDCVYRANIPPAQEGFEEDLVVQAPCDGKITYKTDDAICIEINDRDGIFNKYSILISGFDVTITDNVESNVTEGMQLGKTIRQDLKLVLRDDKGAIVKNEYETVVGDPSTPDNGLGKGAAQNYNNDSNSSSSGNITSSNSKDTRVAKRNPIYTTNQLKKIFRAYNNGRMGANLEGYAQDFCDLQTEYGVNPLFAAAVAIKEQAAGTADSSLSRNNNWFSIRSINGGWKVYSSPSESIDDFGWTIAKGSNYYTQEKYTIYDIGSKYCVPPDEWVKGVTDIMNTLEALK
ncbi:MAG: glucosaminidase domain-containing protein [Clostridia bacterium]|nr:glucosaminidase domain-containing protein [Clostridia bacterium]